MSAVFSSPKAPVIPQAQSLFQAAPARSSEQVQAEVSAQRQRAAGMRGRGSTIMTAVADTQQPTRQKVLLGE